MTFHDNNINKISFQVPYNTNNIFTQNVLFFAGNVRKWIIRFIQLWIINSFLKKTDLDINNIKFLRLLMIID